MQKSTVKKPSVGNRVAVMPVVHRQKNASVRQRHSRRRRRRRRRRRTKKHKGRTKQQKSMPSARSARSARRRQITKSRTRQPKPLNTNNPFSLTRKRQKPRRLRRSPDRKTNKPRAKLSSRTIAAKNASGRNARGVAAKRTEISSARITITVTAQKPLIKLRTVARPHKLKSGISTHHKKKSKKK